MSDERAEMRAEDFLRRRRSSGKKTKEVAHLVRLYGMTPQQAKALIRRVNSASSAEAAEENVHPTDIEKHMREAFQGRNVQFLKAVHNGAMLLQVRIKKTSAYLMYDGRVDAFYVSDGIGPAENYSDIWDAFSAFELMVNPNARADEYTAAEKRKIGAALRTKHRKGESKSVKSTAQVVKNDGFVRSRAERRFEAGAFYEGSKCNGGFCDASQVWESF